VELGGEKSAKRRLRVGARARLETEERSEREGGMGGGKGEGEEPKKKNLKQGRGVNGWAAARTNVGLGGNIKLKRHNRGKKVWPAQE